MISYRDLIKYFLIFIGVLIILVVVIGVFVMNDVKDTEPYKVAVEYATNNSEIKSKTGGVSGIGSVVAYQIKQTTAYITFTVKGKEENVTVYCNLSLSQNKWQVDKMEY